MQTQRRTFLRTTLAGSALACGALAAPAVLRAKTMQWIAGDVALPSDFIAIGLDFFADRVRTLTKGQIDIKTHHASSLGGDRELLEGLTLGSVQVAAPGASILAGWFPPAEVWTYSYMFKDVAHKDRVMTAIMPEYGKAAAERSRMRPLASIPRMPRQMSSNITVTSPADLKGFKVRVPETKMWLRTFERFGASPTPLPFPEVFQALKSKIIDGQDNPLALTLNSGFFEVNKRFALTEHMMADNMIIIAESAWKGLSDDQRAMLNQASREMEDEMRPRVIKDDERLQAEAKKLGVTTNQVDKDAFRAAVKGLSEEFPLVKPWVERIERIS